MVKPRLSKDNSIDTSEGPGEGGDLAGAVEAEVKKSRGKQGDEAVDPPHLQKEGTNTGAPRGHKELGGNGGEVG